MLYFYLLLIIIIRAIDLPLIENYPFLVDEVLKKIFFKIIPEGEDLKIFLSLRSKDLEE
jgi:hypothetical protein